MGTAGPPAPLCMSRHACAHTYVCTHLCVHKHSTRRRGELGMWGWGVRVAALWDACVMGLLARACVWLCLHTCAQLCCTHAIPWVGAGRNQGLLFSGLWFVLV